jgi:hypothetical protein
LLSTSSSKAPLRGPYVSIDNDGTFLEARQGCAVSENNRCVTPRNRDAAQPRKSGNLGYLRDAGLDETSQD